MIRSERLGRTSLADVEETLRMLDHVLADNTREMEQYELQTAFDGSTTLSVQFSRSCVLWAGTLWLRLTPSAVPIDRPMTYGPISNHCQGQASHVLQLE